MKRFKQQLHSSYSPEDTWEALRTPICKPLSTTIYPHLSMAYIKLDASTNLLRPGSHTIIRPASSRHREQAHELQLPGSVSMRVTELADNKRVDVFADNKVLEGFIERRVEAGVGDTSILLVEGELAMKGMAKFLAAFSRMNGQSPERLIFESNQRILDLTPLILTDHADTQNRRQELVSNSA